MILEGFPRGLPGDDEIQETPDAKWTDPAVVAGDENWKYSPRKILLGMVGSRFIGMSDESGNPDDRHIVTLAGSRSGKGVSAIIPNLIAGYKGSVLVIDPKAEAASITARRRGAPVPEGLGQTVYVLDPFGIARGKAADYRAGYNPLSILKPDSETLVEDAGLIGDALVIASGRDTHWDDSARNFIEGLILHVATHPAYDGRRDLVSVRKLLMKGAESNFEGKTLRGQKGLRKEMMELPIRAAGVVDAAAFDFFEKPDNERGSVLSTAQRHTKFLDLPTLQKVLTGTGFDLTELKTNPQGVTVYLCLPASRMGMCGRWFRLFINLAINAMERASGPPASGVQTLFLLDEFHVLGHMQVIATAAALVAGAPYDVKLWTILQDLPQLQQHYEKSWETFLGNAGVIQAFGNSDLTTLKFLSERLGTTTLEVSRHSHTAQEQRLRGATGQSRSPEVHPLLTPEEVSRFFDRDDAQRRQLIIRAGKTPLVLSRAIYHEDEIFEGRYDDPGRGQA